MPQEVIINQKPSIDFQDKVASGTINASATGTKLTFEDGNTYFVIRNGARARLVQVANSVQSGAEEQITFHILINGSRISKQPFDKFSQALGETYRSDGRLGVPIDLPQGALVEISCDNADSANNWLAYARLRIEYEDLY